MVDFSAVTQTALWHPAEQLINLPLLGHRLHQDTQFNAMSDLFTLRSPCIKTPAEHPVKPPLLDGPCAQTGSMYPAVDTTLYAEPGSRHPVEHHVKLPLLVRTLDQGIQLNTMLNFLSLRRNWTKASS